VTNGSNTVAFVPLPQLSPPATLTHVIYQTFSHADPALHSFIQALYARQNALQLRHLATNTTAVQETAFDCGFLPLTLLHTFSRGRISLASTTPLSAPLVDYATPSHPLDAALFTHMLRFNRRATDIEDGGAGRYRPGAWLERND
jgi:choline dehydrogenase